MAINIKYILKKLWPLILLLIISAVTVLSGMKGTFLTDFLNSYFYFALYVLVVGILAHFFGEALPRRFDCEKGFFSCHEWEDNGNFYDRVFHVKKWKDYRFDISNAFGDVRSKNPGMQRDPNELKMILQETCVAELTHWMLTLISPLMLLIVQEVGRVFLLIAYICANLGDIIIQRYNRPRFLKAYKILSRNR